VGDRLGIVSHMNQEIFIKMIQINSGIANVGVAAGLKLSVRGGSLEA
jgi:hypothetical protein